jgi:AbrB family looped-hinge helix DNA binding protein
MKSYTGIMKIPRPDLAIYGTTTIGSKGQIVIPAELRAALGLKAGAKVVIVGSAKKQFVGVMPDDKFQAFLEILNHQISQSLALDTNAVVVYHELSQQYKNIKQPKC